MLNWNDLDLAPAEKKLRSFGLVLAALALGGGCWKFFLGQERTAFIAATLALVPAALALVRPTPLRPLYIGLTVLTFPIGWVISRLILLTVFFVVFVPFGAVMRLIGRDRLHLRFDSSASSYWESKTVDDDPESYLRQF